MGRHDDNGIEIVPFVGIYGEISLLPILFIVLIPLGFLLSIFVHLADFLAESFILSSIIYHVLAIGISVLITKIKSIRNISRARLMDSISNFLMFFMLYLFTYFYFIPHFFLSGAIFSWLLSSAFIAFIVFLQQCFSRAIPPVVNLIVCSVIFIVAFIILRNSIDNSTISTDFLVRIYGLNLNGGVRIFLETFLF